MSPLLEDFSPHSGCHNRKLDLKVCPRPFPAVPHLVLFLIKFMRTTATFEGQGWHPLKGTDFTFTGKDSRQEDISSSKTESDSGKQRTAESRQILSPAEVISLTYSRIIWFHECQNRLIMTFNTRKDFYTQMCDVSNLMLTDVMRLPVRQLLIFPNSFCC